MLPLRLPIHVTPMKHRIAWDPITRFQTAVGQKVAFSSQDSKPLGAVQVISTGLLSWRQAAGDEHIASARLLPSPARLNICLCHMLTQQCLVHSKSDPAGVQHKRSTGARQRSFMPLA